MSAAEWREVELGDVIDLHDSKRKPLSGKERSARQGIYPYYGASGVIDHLDDYMLDGNYLLVSEDGENLNSRKLPIAFWAKGKFWVNNHAHIILGKEGKANTDFIRLWLLQANISGYITGAAQPKLSQGNLCRIKLDIPEIETQNKIASVLSNYDNLIENNNRRIAILEDMAQSLYREWFVKFRFPGHENVKFKDSSLGQIPEGWEVKSVDECYKTSSGGTPSRKKPEYYGDDYWWTKTKELKDGFITSVDEKISELGLVKSSAKLFPKDTVLLAMYGATIGRLGVLTHESATNQACCALLPLHEMYSPWFIYLTLLAKRPDLLALGQGAAQQNISQQVIKGFKIIIPEKMSLEVFNNTVTPIFREIELLLKSSHNLKQQRDMLLPKLISGKINLKD